MSSEKTEQPSKRKLSDARKKGQIFKSKDITDNATILAAVVAIKLLAPYIQNQYTLFIQQILTKDMVQMDTNNILQVVNIAILFFAKITLPILLAILVISIASNLGQVGFLFTTQTLKIDFKKIDPIQGFKRIFSKKSFIDVLKFLLKFSIITIIISVDIAENVQATNTLVFFSARTSIVLMLSKLFDLLIKIISILAAFSFFDYFIQKRMYITDMRMSKKEVKDEHKQSEGDPLLKGKLKEKQREISSNTMIKAASEATMLLANPTHIAVCIHYELGMTSAPIITAMARDHVAQKLKEVARENNVPIIENKPLARALYNDGEVNEPIPNEYFKTIAEILITILYTDTKN